VILRDTLRGIAIRAMQFFMIGIMCAESTFLVGCDNGGDRSSPIQKSSAGEFSNDGRARPPVSLSLTAQVGRKLFFDKNLSRGKNMACSTCHDPQFSYGPPNNLSVQLGSQPSRIGQRAVPSLCYKSMTPSYSDIAENPDGISQNAPGGGFMWDGRAPTLAAQSALPLLNPIEMDNESRESVVQTIQNASYARLFQQAFGAKAFADVGTAFDDIGIALQAFQEEDPSFAPYSSKFDLFISNKIGGGLTPAEMRGLRLFNDTKDGAGCAACHYTGANFGGSVALMTDFTYQALGVPRNDTQIPKNSSPIPATSDAAYVDMGLCGVLNAMHMTSKLTRKGRSALFSAVREPDSYCGRFKVPTLRNVATRHAFFHNGVFHTLEQVLNFYNTRDTNPEYWYPSSGGDINNVTRNPIYALYPTYASGATTLRFNDLPVAYHGNIDEELPMGQGQTNAGGTTVANGAKSRPLHSIPKLTQLDIADLICFLNTLTDGYRPSVSSPPGGPCVN
jgi:cytochrome c peroxidase